MTTTGQLESTGALRYLFPRLTGNRRGTRAWETGHYDLMLRQLGDALELRDTSGRPLRYSHSHRLKKLIEHRPFQ